MIVSAGQVDQMTLDEGPSPKFTSAEYLEIIRKSKVAARLIIDWYLLSFGRLWSHFLKPRPHRED